MRRQNPVNIAPPVLPGPVVCHGLGGKNAGSFEPMEAVSKDVDPLASVPEFTERAAAEQHQGTDYEQRPASPKVSTGTLTGRPERRFGVDFLATEECYTFNLQFAIHLGLQFGLAARLVRARMWMWLFNGPEEKSQAESQVVSMSAFQSFPRITPFLWFDSNAEEAVDFYLTVFRNSRRLDEVRTTDDNRGPKGSILTIAFELDGQKFTALNGGPMFKFTEAVSFVVRCDSQQEVDDYWSKLSAEGSGGQFGWVKDKFGLAWQIVPSCLPDLVKGSKAMQAMLRMKKLDIAVLERAEQS